jgi:oligopeptide/dipeptide ABC transporter ATP-binding protein
LEIKNLAVSFHGPRGRLTALDTVSFHIAPGEVVGLVGESGCGKSVCALSILGLLPGGSTTEIQGRVTLDGTNLLSLPPKAMRRIRGGEISMIFQEPLSALNPVLTIGNQVAEVYRAHERISRSNARRKTIEILAQVGLSDPQRRLRQYPHELSGGMRQRVLIAIALACNPRLLLADEPTTALDVTVQAQILELLSRLQSKRQLAVLFITHDLGIVAQSCHRVVVLYSGHVVETAPTAALFRNPAHPYTQGLLDCLPKLRTTPQQNHSSRRLPEMEGRLPDPLDRPAGCRFAPRCRRKTDICTQKMPQLESLPASANGCPRSVRCYHPLNG